MKKKLMFCSIIMLGLSGSASADTSQNEVTISNGSPKLGQMVISYRVLANNPTEGLKQSAPTTIFVDQSTKINLEAYGSSSVTLVPLTVNGHTITEETNALQMIKKADACAITVDSKHSTGKLRFTEVTKSKGSSYITCATEGGTSS